MGISQGDNGNKKKGVSIVTCTNKLIYMDNIFANYERQDYAEKELIIVLNNNQLSIRDWEQEAGKHSNVRVYQLDEGKRLGACLNFGVEKAALNYVAKFDDDDHYAPAYLQDMVSAFDYSGADIVGKHAHYVYFENGQILATQSPSKEQCFTSLVAGPTMIIKREVFKKVKFNPDKARGEDTQFLRDSIARGFKVYSADRFNFVRMRRAQADLHTWTKSDEEQLAYCEVVSFVKDYATHVTC
jgi:cellulose synthase/poly-beta-1,6-N-acetylglucosamine synthase-like glycosyltransferase